MKLNLSVYLIFFFIVFLGTSCRKKRVVNTSFYYWKTVYLHNETENQYFNKLNCKKLYVRIMDVDEEDGTLIPISPVVFKSPVPDSVELVPVVFIVNQAIKNQTHTQLDELAAKTVRYVNGKLGQAGKRSFRELQIDCDWTQSTRDNYFYLLRRIRQCADLKNKQLSVTLRLHQLKNQRSSGIPPADRVMLMCYNMGNLRKYGNQNSILQQSELEKYAGDNLSFYPMPVDIGLPLFRWAVVFRQKQYAGIAKRLNISLPDNKKLFRETDHNLYKVLGDLPDYGLKRGDEVRWETVSPDELEDAARYLQKFVTSDTLRLIYFHLDEPTLKYYRYETLEKTASVFR